MSIIQWYINYILCLQSLCVTYIANKHWLTSNFFWKMHVGRTPHRARKRCYLVQAQKLSFNQIVNHRKKSSLELLALPHTFDTFSLVCPKGSFRLQQICYDQRLTLTTNTIIVAGCSRIAVVRTRITLPTSYLDVNHLHPVGHDGGGVGAKILALLAPEALRFAGLGGPLQRKK